MTHSSALARFVVTSDAIHFYAWHLVISWATDKWDKGRKNILIFTITLVVLHLMPSHQHYFRLVHRGFSRNV